METVISDTSCDTVTYYFGKRKPLEEDPEFSENEDEEDSSEFHGELNGLEALITISEFSGLDDEVKDTLTAEVPFTYLGIVGTRTLDFTETGRKSKIFRARIVYGGTPPVTHDEWSVKKVKNLAGAPEGNYNPICIRVKGIANPDDYVIELEGQQFQLEEFDGNYYLKGGSLNILMPTIDFDESGIKIIYFDLENNCYQKMPLSAGGLMTANLKLKDNLNKIIASAWFVSFLTQMDIRETARPTNRVGYNDPITAKSARNKILIWHNQGGDEISFDMVRLPGATGDIWVQIEDLTGLNSQLPICEKITSESKTYTFTVRGVFYSKDLLVKYGIDTNKDGKLTKSEIYGKYEVYGITDSEHGLANIFYFGYFAAFSDIAYQLHNRFYEGAFLTEGDYAPYIPRIEQVTLSSDRFTHLFGTDFSPAGYVFSDRTLRDYFKANAQIEMFCYDKGSPGSDYVKEDDTFKDGLISFINKNLSKADLQGAFAPGETSKDLTFTIDNFSFDFGATGGIGLGGVSVSKDGNDSNFISHGKITLHVINYGTSFEVDPSVHIDITLYDLFDFNYFNPSIEALSQAPRTAAIFQNSQGRPNIGNNIGKCFIVKIRIDSDVSLRKKSFLK